MRIDEIISTVNLLEPNQYDDETKLQWISELDGKIFREVICTHDNPPERVMDRARDVDEDGFIYYPPYESVSEEPIVGQTYGREMYSHWLQAKIALHNMETGKYDREATVFNAAFGEFSAWYNRTHRPISYGRLRF